MHIGRVNDMAGNTETVDEHAALFSLAAWADKPTATLRQINSRFTLPTIAKVVSGRYRSIAPADSKRRHHHHHSSHRRSSSVVFIQSVRTSQKVSFVVTYRRLLCGRNLTGVKNFIAIDSRFSASRCRHIRGFSGFSSFDTSFVNRAIAHIP